MKWPTAPIGQLVTIRGGGTPPRDNEAYFSGAIPWVTPKDMKGWEIVDSELRISEDALANSAAKLVPENTVLLVVRSGVLKHTAPIALNRRPVAINQDMKSLECDRRLSPDFLARFLKASEPIILSWVRATTADNYSIENIRRLEVPLPPLDEQQRIAAILDQADGLRRKRLETLRIIGDLGQSTFTHIFGTPRSRNSPWRIVRLGDVTTKIGSGATPTGGEASYKKEGVTLIRSMNVHDGIFASHGLAYLDDAQANSLEAVSVEANDVLLNITGASVARVCRAPSWVLPARVNQHVSIIRPTDDLNGTFLESVLLHPVFKRHLLKIAGAGATRQAITKAQIEELQVPLPPIDLQQAFASRVAEIEKLKAAYRAHLAELDALFASLQHRAFRGEL